MIDDRSLDIGIYPVNAVGWGAATRWSQGRLDVGRSELLDLLATEPRLRVVDAGLFSPGERVRLTGVLDVIEPRAKAGGPGDVFGGIAGEPGPSGEGRTDRLAGAAVVICGRFADEGDALRQPQRAYLDMDGPGARYAPFAALHLVALHVAPAPGTDNAGFDAAVRRAGCLAARHLAGACRGLPASRVERHRFGDAPEGLPRVCQVVFLPTFGRLMTSFVYGAPADGLLPLPLHPNELHDGALVCGEYHYAGQRSYTYSFQCNAAGAALARRHGHTLRVGPVVVSRVHNTDGQKRRAACQAADLLRLVGARAAVISAAAAGNAHIDAMFAVAACEAAGVRAALIQVETSSPAGDDPPLVDFVPEADMVVSTGNREQRIRLPAVDRVFGTGEREARAACEVPLREICGANQQLGGGVLAARSG